MAQWCLSRCLVDLSVKPKMTVWEREGTPEAWIEREPELTSVLVGSEESSGISDRMSEAYRVERKEGEV